MDIVRFPRFSILAGACALGGALALSAARPSTDDGVFTEVQRVPGLDSPFRDVSPHVSRDGLTLWFASLDRPGAPGKDDLYVATRPTTADPFGNVELLAISTRFVDGSPSVSHDGRTLYFYSDRPGGEGGFDLWSASRDDATRPFANPMNLGPDVNGPFDDRGPSVSADGLALFFSSNRPESLGGNDLWMATRASTAQAFGAVVHLGAGPNSTSEDRAPSISADGLTLFFFSDRPGGEGFQDLWVATRDSMGAPFGAAASVDARWPGSDVNAGGWEVTPDVSHRWPHLGGSKLYFSRIVTADDFDLFEASWVRPWSSAVGGG